MGGWAGAGLPERGREEDAENIRTGGSSLAPSKLGPSVLAKCERHLGAMNPGTQPVPGDGRSGHASQNSQVIPGVAGLSPTGLAPGPCVHLDKLRSNEGKEDPRPVCSPEPM